MLGILKALFDSKGDSHPLITEACGRLTSMLAETKDLLEKAVPWLLNKETPSELLAEARSVDKRSNKSEREIRKLLVEALAFNHYDGAICLVLMSAAKDGERLVDECRNLLDIGALVDTPIPESYGARLKEHTGTLIGLVDETRSAFAKNDEAKAIDLVEGEKPFIAALNVIQDEILNDTSLTPRQAIVVSRAFRYLHRIRAHLANIASTVVFPVHQIDFAKRSYVQQAKNRLKDD